MIVLFKDLVKLDAILFENLDSRIIEAWRTNMSSGILASLAEEIGVNHR